MNIEISPIKALRENLKLSQSQAAKKAGMTQPHWHNIENGKTNPTINVFVRIARTLEIPFEKLLELLDKKINITV